MAKQNKYKKTPNTLRIIYEAIADGLTQRDAAVLAGISEDTLSLWKSDDSEFSEQIRKKEIEHKRKLLGIIERAAERSWQAAAWRLERKYKEEFSDSKSIQESMEKAERQKALDDIGASIRAICENK
jgi:hypothetical protein